MLKLYKIKHYLNDNRKNFFISLLVFTLGFICGSLYINFITELDFSKSASSFLSFKDQNSSQNYSYSDEINIAGIFFGSFFLFGKWIVSFFIFRYGFMTGYFCVFLIKLLNTAGIAPACVFLLLNLIFTLPFVIILSHTGYTVSGSIESVFFKNYTLYSNPSKLITLYTALFTICIFLLTLTSRLKMNLFWDFIKNFL